MEAGSNMICPKCGVTIPDGRNTCQNCGSAVTPQGDYIGGSQYDLTQPQNIPPVYKKERGSRKKVIGIVIVIIVIIVDRKKFKVLCKNFQEKNCRNLSEDKNQR